MNDALMDTGNLPAANLATTTYTGNGASQCVAIPFKPDMIWTKNATYPTAFNASMKRIDNGFVVSSGGKELFAKDLEEAAKQFIALFTMRELDK